MWCQKIDRTEFIKRLYKVPPELVNVQVNNMTVFPNDKKVVLTCILRQSPDWIPPKWQSKKGNSIKVELSFWGISAMKMEWYTQEEYCTIDVSQTLEKGIQLRISGAINSHFFAEACAVSNVEYVYVCERA